MICDTLKVSAFMPKNEFAKVIIERYDYASWIEISSRLYGLGEIKAVEAAKKYLPISFQGETSHIHGLPVTIVLSYLQNATLRRV